MGLIRSHIEAENFHHRGWVRRSDTLLQALYSSHVFFWEAQTSSGEVGLEGIHVPLESTTAAWALNEPIVKSGREGASRSHRCVV